VRPEDFDYALPERLIAQTPAVRREDARLLVLDRRTGAVSHRGVSDLPVLLAPGDLLVVNDTRVVPARLFARRASGGRVELLLLEPAPADAPRAWTALLRANRPPKPGETLALAAPDAPAAPALRLLARRADGPWVVEPLGADLPALMARHGEMPLPPYIERAERDPRAALDRERYQTVFAREPGAVAAPTAGLHLTEALLAQARARGVELAAVTLHVGAGTFLPVSAARLEDHRMHAESYDVPAATAAAVRAAKSRGARVAAVGTTAVRALEAAALGSPDGLPQPGAGRTDLYVLPGFRFRVVDALLTNFHLPRSTLLCLVSAFAGRERVLAAYAEAVAREYRFFSYGDAMWIA
jgi:S-adenosylmethionine:tRNA ribosyltransferase-isomerase